MVDFARVRNRIYYGYGKAAERLGVTHSIYRSADGINPIQPGNLLGTQLISIDDNLRYDRARKYGDNVWQLMPQDGLGTTLFALNTYDYMVGPTVTYFIADVQPDDRLSPPACVECNAIITIVRPTNATIPIDGNDYQQYQPGHGTTIVSNCPVSILTYGSRSNEQNLNLPTSTKLPSYAITMPDFDDVIVNAGDIITDNDGRTLIISAAERTKRSLGFRLIASQLGT